MTDTKPDTPAPRVRREMRPERIDVGSDELVRNDVLAKEYGRSVRGLDREDAKGAPYTHVAGVKYRPLRAFKQFLASKIKVRGQPSKRRGRR